MKLVIQRVQSASVSIEGRVVANINKGFLVFVGLKTTDNEDIFDWVINKIKNLRIFDDEDGLINKSIVDLDLEVLFVSQFTLYGDCLKGNRPSFIEAMNSVNAKSLYEKFVFDFKNSYSKVQNGVFGADMQIALVNDGPITIILEKN